MYELFMQHASTGAAERNPRAQTFPKLNMYGFFFYRILP